MQVVDIVLDNFLEGVQSVFRNSFTMRTNLPEEFNPIILEEIATSLGDGLSNLSCADYLVRGFKAYLMEYDTNPLYPLQWVRVGVMLQGELDIVGKRSVLPTTKLPYGVGMYVIQNDSRITGRPGKLLLKTGFWEEMLVAYATTWKIGGASTGVGQWNTFWANTVASDGEWGKYFIDGDDGNARMVNLHKGTATPSDITSFTQKHINKYRVPRPVLV